MFHSTIPPIVTPTSAQTQAIVDHVLEIASNSNAGSIACNLDPDDEIVRNTISIITGYAEEVLLTGFTPFFKTKKKTLNL